MAVNRNLFDVDELDEQMQESQQIDIDPLQFQIHIVVSPLGGTDVTVSGGTGSSVQSRVPRDRLPPIAVPTQGDGNRRQVRSTPSGTGTGYGSKNGARSRLAGHHLMPVLIPQDPSAGPRGRTRVRAPRTRSVPAHLPLGGASPHAQPMNGGTHAAEVEDEASGDDTISSDQVTSYLRSHPDFLERYVMEEIDVERLERWVIRGSQRSRHRQGDAKNCRKSSLSRWRFCVHADKRHMLQELTKSLQLRPTKAHVLWELAACIASAVSADGFQLYISERGDPEQLGLYLEHDAKTEIGDSRLEPLKPGSAPGYVAKTREPLRLSRDVPDVRFLDNSPFKGDASHVLYQAVVQPDGQLVAVLELWRRDAETPFYEEDDEIASSYLVWGGIALHYANLYLSMNKQRKLNDFLLAVVKSIFQDMVSMDALVIKVMNFAQRLVDADRASLFLVDNRNKELYARIFDVGLAGGVAAAADSGSEDSADKKISSAKEIRFPVGTGIAGQVALTGEILNIADAYSDPRFNRTIDQLTGYHTKSILCMPIFTKNNVIGVVQMVNKHSGAFTKEDEEAFEMFAVYCGLALHHAKLYDKIARSEQKYRVALEVLSYHNTSSELEVSEARSRGIPEELPGVDDFYFNVFKLDDFAKARHSIFMFKDLFGLSRFDADSLIRFTLTVKKNYRRVPYHNWTHGFSVANSMYSIIKHAQGALKPNECLALFIGSLCHDLDHRGKNNKFMSDTESPLASIYSTSTMEHHHFNQTVTILQQKGHNIFSKLTSGEYKQVLSHVKHCILATDLAMFFPNKAKLSELIAHDTFSWNNTEHRLLLEAMAMTASDLSASAKPWDTQVETVKVIFEEFYEQGDAEKAAGRTPIPMMDRSQPEQQAMSQVGFITGICIPCYTILSTLIPGSKPLLDQCQSNLERWQEIDDYEQEKLKLAAAKTPRQKSPIAKVDDERSAVKSSQKQSERPNSKDLKTNKAIVIQSIEVPKVSGKNVDNT